MQYEFPQALNRFLFILLVVSLVAANARPPHFGENTQALSSDQQELSSNSLMDTGLRPWQIELLAQRMAELNQLNSQLSNPLNGQDYGTFDRALRSGNEIKRQSRYRLCYFNPVSCFKK